MIVGTMVELKKETMGNPVGTIGYVFEEYQDFDHLSGTESFTPDKTGVQVIFPNGQYCGYGYSEQDMYFREAGFSPHHSHYKFKGVMWVSKEHDAGFWFPEADKRRF